VGRSYNFARGGHRRCRRSQRDAEVSNNRPTAPTIYKDVVRLDVAVHNPLLVSLTQRPRYLLHDPCRFRGGEWPRALYPLPKGFAVDEAHREEHNIRRVFNTMNGNDVWVRETGRRASLAKEALAQRL
jgi:hypothetical protein